MEHRLRPLTPSMRNGRVGRVPEHEARTVRACLQLSVHSVTAVAVLNLDDAISSLVAGWRIAPTRS